MTGKGSPALAIFLVSRAAVWALAAFVVVVFDGSLNPERDRWDSERLHELGAIADVLARWDSDWYLRIAESGYDWPSSTPAFFPLYPLLVAVVGAVLLGHPLLAGVLISLAAGAAAFVLLERLARAHLGPASARRSIVYVALFPASVFLGAVYSESLFLLLAVGVFVLAERGRLPEAGVVTGLALLTRPAGVAVLLALVVFAWRGDRVRGAWSVAIAAVIGLLYPLVLWVWIGEPLALFEAQETVWRRELSPLGPLGDLWSAVDAREILELAVVVGALALCVAAWRRFGAPYGLYGLAVIVIPLSFPADGRPLLSAARFVLVAFPVFLALAPIAERRVVHWAICGVFAAGLAVVVVKWALWEWVA